MRPLLFNCDDCKGMPFASCDLFSKPELDGNRPRLGWAFVSKALESDTVLVLVIPNLARQTGVVVFDSADDFAPVDCSIDHTSLSCAVADGCKILSNWENNGGRSTAFDAVTEEFDEGLVGGAAAIFFVGSDTAVTCDEGGWKREPPPDF